MNRFERLTRVTGTIVAAIGAVAAGVLPAVLVGTPPAASADAASMTLITQDLALATDAPLTISFIPPADITATDTIVVGAYRPVENRKALADVIAGEYGSVVDKVSIDPNDPATFSTATESRVTITIPSESVSDTPEALQFPRPGLYPVTVEVRGAGGSLVGVMLTFVDRLPTATAASPTSPGASGTDKGSLDVAVVASITAPPAIPGADTPLPDAVTAQIENLVQYPDTVPLSVSISPEVLGRLDAKTLESLRTVMARSLVLSQPSIPLDPSAAAAAAAVGEQELFTRLLQTGEDQTTPFAATRPSRAAWIETEPLTTAGAGLLRELGVGLLLLSPQTYAATAVADGNLRDYTLYSQMRDTELADGSSIPAAVFEPTIDRYLVDESMSPEMAALYTAADLVAWRDQLYSDQRVEGNSVLLGLPSDGGLPFDRVTRLVDMATKTGAATFVDLSNYSRSTATQKVPDFETLTLAPQQPADLTGRAPTLAELAARQSTVTSMLSKDPIWHTAERTDRWVHTIQVLNSSAITDAQVQATASSLIKEFDAITSAVIAPGSDTFTMNGMSTNLYPRIGNTGDEPLTVKVRLQSSADKMRFPAGDVTVELPAHGVARPKIPVRARSNGSFTVTLQVFAIDGVTKITEPTIFKAQVNALTGLAQVFTGGALLILLTWWVRNLRRNRRLRRNETSMSSHPAGLKTVAVAVATVDAASSASSTSSASAVPTSISTATTGTATITAATTIIRLDSGIQLDSGAQLGTRSKLEGGAGPAPGDSTSASGDSESTTLSDS